MEINEDQANAKSTAKVIYSGHCHLSLEETQRQTEEGESFVVEKRKALDMPQLEAVGLGKLWAG